MRQARKCGSNWGCYYFLLEKQTVKCSVQCHVFVLSPTGRRPNDKYPVSTSHRSDLCKNVSLQCYLVATVIHIHSLCSQICVLVYIYTYYSRYRDAGRAREIKMKWDSSEFRVPRKSSRVPFWSRVPNFVSPGLGGLKRTKSTSVRIIRCMFPSR